jgi:MraZ protein
VVEKEVKIVFLGNFQHNIDKKGRVFIPSKFREELGEEFIISKDILGKRCLCVYSLPEWEKFVEGLNSLPNTKSSTVKRYLFANAFTVGFDSQGRILVPANLREHACLEEKADILGVGNKVEIWNTDFWAEENESSTPESIAATMMELGF